jgi:UDP-N-acetylglucosamine 2-epimerase (non-hydrolysing)
VPEECCIFNVPVLTIRDFIERQETIECGSNILVGTKKEDILEAFNVVLNRKYTWVPPEEYLKPNVSDTVINILTGKI